MLHLLLQELIAKTITPNLAETRGVLHKILFCGTELYEVSRILPIFSTGSRRYLPMRAVCRRRPLTARDATAMTAIF